LNVALYIARRYLFSSKSKNAVNSITAISVLGVAVGTLALVVVLSVFNGFETLIKSMYQEVNPDFEVTSAVSKSFTLTDGDFEELKSLAPWDAVEQVYQEKVLLRVANKEQIALLKGVHLWPANSFKSIKNHIIKGSSYTDLDTDNWAVIGQSLAYTLSVSVNEVLKIFVPNQKANATINNSQAFKEKQFMLAGIYAVQAEYDAAYILADLGVVQDFLDKPLALTSLAFSIAGSHDLSDVQQTLQMHFGSDFEVKNRFEQQEFLYKVLQTEKWAIFFILAFILLIATFTIVASVVMIVLEKRKDISSLWALGAPVKTIQKIFFYEGLLITIFGGGLGLVLGVSVCLLQQHFGFIQLGSQGSFIVNSYPVEVHYKDVVLIVCTVLSLGILITFIPVRLLKQKFIQQH
jgi:lipoprotein-releasing system permease protein|tara:strand:- start:1030 stop:2247 length:1218 start_codon:yes stop_codon:yes gene_type:complete